MGQTQTNKSYLVFGVETEFFAVSTLYVREILEYKKPTAMPVQIPCILGVINLRGQIIPIFDLWALFGLGKTKIEEKNYFVILELAEAKEHWILGILVQNLSDVVEFSNNLEIPPDFGSQVPARFLEGIGKINERFILVLSSTVCFHPENLRRQIFNYLKREEWYAY